MVLLRVWFGCFQNIFIDLFFFTKTVSLKCVDAIGTFLLFQMFPNDLPLHWMHVYSMTFWMMPCRPVNPCELLLKRKIEQNTSAIWFCKVQLLLLDILLSLSLVYSLLKLNFKIHSFFTNIFNLKYNWEKHHKSKSYL